MKDDFANRFLPVDHREFIDRSGTWLCELTQPVDISGVDRRVFLLRFTLLKPDPREQRSAGERRHLELRTSLASFHNLDGKEAGYAGWLELVIQGFLSSDKTSNVIEAYCIERG